MRFKSKIIMLLRKMNPKTRQLELETKYENSFFHYTLTFTTIFFILPPPIIGA